MLYPRGNMQINIEDKEFQAALQLEVRKYLKTMTREMVREVVEAESQRILKARFEEAVASYMAQKWGREVNTELRKALTTVFQDFVKSGERSPASQALIDAFEGHMPFRDAALAVMERVVTENVPSMFLQVMKDMAKPETLTLPKTKKQRRMIK